MNARSHGYLLGAGVAVAIALTAYGTVRHAAGMALAVAGISAFGVARVLGWRTSESLILGLITAHLFLGDIDLGPASPRMYLLLLLIGIVVAGVAAKGRPLIRTPEAQGVAVTYLCLVGWVAFARVVRGESVAHVATILLSTFLFAIASFVVIQHVCARRVAVAGVAGTLVGAALISAVVGILQWWDVGIALRVTDWLHPVVHEIGDEGYAAWTGIRGLTTYSIPFSYHLLIGGSLVATWAALQLALRRRLGILAGGIVVATVSIAMLLSQSRSALVALLLAGALGATWLARRHRGGLGLGRGGAFVATMAVVMAAAFVLLGPVGAGSDRSATLSRVTDWQDPLRQVLTSLALEYGIQHALVGGGLAGYADTVESVDRARRGATAPHNMFLTALVSYGIPGVLILCVLLWQCARVCIATIRLYGRGAERTAWIGLGTAAALIAYCFNGLFHNDSFITSGVLGMWLVGLLCADLGWRRAQEGHARQRRAPPARDGRVPDQFTGVRSGRSGALADRRPSARAGGGA
jgi:hypothetical protein